MRGGRAARVRYRKALERIASETELVGLGQLDEPQFQPPGAAQRELRARMRIAREALDSVGEIVDEYEGCYCGTASWGREFCYAERHRPKHLQPRRRRRGD